MKTSLLAALFVVAGCNVPFGETCTDDPLADHFALNPATGECWEFASSCDVPDDWASCGSGCNTPDDCAAGETCQAGECVPVVACAGDPDCPTGQICLEGVCQLPGPECFSDDDCALTEHCDYNHTPTPGPGPQPGPVPRPPGDSDALYAQGYCVNNDRCSSTVPCVDPLWCDFSAGGGSGDCDPTAPGCGGGEGLCSRGTPDRECFSDVECLTGEICPAQYGGCSAEMGGITCPSYCETICYDDTYCTAEFRCNNNEICATPSPSPGVPLPCAGWCVLR